MIMSFGEELLMRRKEDLREGLKLHDEHLSISQVGVVRKPSFWLESEFNARAPVIMKSSERSDSDSELAVLLKTAR